MKDFSKKQKIIIGIIIAIVVIAIGIYGYFSLSAGEDVWEIADNGILENSEKVDDIEGNAISQSETKNENKIENNVNELEGKIVVHITGAVKKTGILVLPEGARIADAIRAAEGTTKDADLEEVNLAYTLEDGQKLYIPKKQDKTKIEEKVYITSESGNNVIKDSMSTNTGKGENQKVNINTATQSQLEELPGIGPSIAARIIEYRQQNGKFQKIEELQNVKGIGDAKFSNVKDYVTV